jgi:hypothetical protein
LTIKLMRDAIAHLQDTLDLELQDLAGATGVDLSAVVRWYSGQSRPQRRPSERLDELLELEEQLVQSLGGARQARRWMHTDSPYLGLIKPVEALRAGRIDRVRGALEAMDAGISV